MNPYLALSGAIVLEVIATSLLKASDGMSKLVPTAGALVCFGLCFYFLSITMKSIPTGIAYAIWSGVGIILISLIGLFIFKQKLDLPAIIGICMIAAGVITINLFSHSATH
ncbi:TPA: SMR family transporter [Stenotrophomonas maltophilia]